MPEVSVIIPTYNCAQYIKDAVESALNQTYKDVEVIVVDDGSTDNTKEILEPYLNEGLIRYFYQENKGQSAARNLGIINAKGNYIAFLDSDDTLTENSIEKRLNLLKVSAEVGLVFSEYYYEPKEGVRISSGNLIKEDKKYYKFIKKNPHGVIFDGSFKDIFEVFFLIHTSTVLVRRNVFNEVGLFKKLLIAEDRDMWLKIGEHYKVAHVPIPLATYRNYGSGITRDDALRYGFFRVYFHCNILNRFKNDRYIRKFLRKRLSIIYRDIAIYFIDNNMKLDFLINILNSIYYNPFYKPSLMLLIGSLIPHKLKKILKKLVIN